MLTKYKKKNKIFLILTSFVLIIVMSTMVNATKASNDNIIELTKDEALLMAVENSSVIRDLNNSVEDMVMQYSDMKKGTKMLRQLYDLLPRYSYLFNKSEITNSTNDYKRYYELQQQMLIDQPRLEEIEAELLVEVDMDKINALNAEKVVIIDRINELSILETSLSEEEKANIITIGEDYELQILKQQFAVMGILNPNISNRQEYETFIYPLEVAPNALQAGIRSMKIGVDVAKAGIVSGSEQLYNTLLTMNGFYELQIKGHKLKESQLNTISEKYKVGKATKGEADKAANDLIISSLEINKMKREIENLEMNFKMMLGLKLTAKLNFVDEQKTSKEIKILNYYIEEALKNRSDIQTIEVSLDTKKVEFEYVEDYYSRFSDSYLIIKSEINEINLEIQETRINIEKEIREAYMDVLQKEKDVDIKEKELSNMKNQIQEMERYFALGYLTQDSIDGYQMFVMQKENDYKSAVRNYNYALKAIENASMIGPGYSNGQGGISFEE